MKRAHHLLALSVDYRRRIAKARNAGSLGRVIDSLFATPAVTVPALARMLNISYPAAKKTTDRLVRAEILRRVAVGKTNFYFADAIIKLLEAP